MEISQEMGVCPKCGRVASECVSFRLIMGHLFPKRRGPKKVAEVVAVPEVKAE